MSNINKYNRIAEAFTSFISGNDIISDFFKEVDFVYHYPGLEDAVPAIQDRYHIFSNLDNFAFHCNRYLDNKGKRSEKNMLTELMEYKEQLLAECDPIIETWEYFDHLDIEAQQYLDILFMRTMYPLEGLRTLRVESLLDSDELEKLYTLEKNPGYSSSMNPVWKKEKPIQYNNYCCFIVKLTRLCNLRCRYCQDWREGPGNTIDISAGFRMLSNIFCSEKFRNIEFVWHGGEPTLFGLKNLYKLLYAISYLKGRSQSITNSIQTNGLSLPLAWIKLFRVFDFNVGLSIDGPDEIHNSNRPDINDRPTFERVKKSIYKLRQNGITNNIIMVGNEAIMNTNPQEILDFLMSMEIYNCCILPVLPGNCHRAIDFDYTSYRKKYFNFLFELHYCRQKQDLPVRIREIDTLIKIMRSENPRHCELLGNCIGTFFSIDPDGSVNHCDKYVYDKKYTLGNLLSTSIDDILAGEKVRQLKEENITSVSNFSSCKFFKKCQGWCPHEYYLNKMYNKEQPDCCGLNYLLDKL